MVDSEYTTKLQNYETNIGAIIRDSEMLRNDPNYLKTKDV